ncbi:cupin domain-containing protein [Siccirubricoccus sp. KC 17139]|uniref:Cupin domain-containing protein n=1 Tax=Siccirubricoccus soli TaxID=2899147 RepID=A0ABT1D4V9_9PROT|nr:cupin domain-containing protein [Siccirubricoccus soli]MCO6416941.1 cupin domain-containing protein [Siccirubricoccus soli]MCP2683076.1 cupin domain-containing protein [Siccirubricoccus soli]
MPDDAPIAAPKVRTTVTHAASAQYDSGLRPFFAYRDLGIARATGGSYGANVIRAVPGTHANPVWHTHTLDFQLVFVLRGWVRFEYADIGEVRLEAGDSVLQAPGIAHRELEHSDDLELVEITSPGEFETKLVEGP